MAGTEQTRDDQGDIHRSFTFAGSIRALLSVAVYGGIGMVVGHYIGRWGEQGELKRLGMSTFLGRWIGGLGIGGLAGYSALLGAAEDERAKDNLVKRNAELEAQVKELRHESAGKHVQAGTSEHHGAVTTASLERVE